MFNCLLYRTIWYLVNLLVELVWPSGKALVSLVSRETSVRICFGSPFSSTVVVTCDFVPHNYETLKWFSGGDSVAIGI